MIKTKSGPLAARELVESIIVGFDISEKEKSCKPNSCSYFQAISANWRIWSSRRGIL